MLAVIKNNGYGLGVVQLGEGARSRRPSVHGFAVVKLQEALDLREQGIKKPVLLMAPVDERDLQLAVSRDIMPMVYTPIGDLLERESRRLGPPHSDPRLHRHRHRPRRRAVPAGRRTDSRSRLAQGRHDRRHDDDLHRGPRVRSRADRALHGADRRARSRRGIKLGRLHAASTYTLFQHGQETCFDMVRVGMALLGIYPDAKFKAMKILDLKPALALRVRVAYVKQLAAGTSAGYDRAYMAKKHTWIATLPVGPRRWLAAPGRERRPRPHQRQDVSGDRVGIGEPHAGRDRRHAGREGRRRGDAV